MNTQNSGSNKPKDLITQDFSAPLGAAAAAKVNIDTSTGNLCIDGQAEGDQLVNGTFQYSVKKGAPVQSLDVKDGQAVFSLDGQGGFQKPGFRFPWSACNGAMDWNVHINPAVAAEINARTGGGSVRLNLAGMRVAGVTADSGGGDMEVVLPDIAANLSVIAKTGGGSVRVDIGCCTTGSTTLTATSGAGNVEICVPRGLAALIHCGSGMGKVSVSTEFNQVDKETFQSPDYNTAADKIEITARSGAGSVSIIAKQGEHSETGRKQ